MKYRFLTGSYSQQEQPGICRVAFDPEVGFTLETAGTGYANPSFVLPNPNGRFLYAVEETDSGSVCARALDGGLSKQGEGLSTQGASPCHLALSGDLRRLYAANYSSGSLAAFALDGAGNLAGRTDVVRHVGSGPNRQRQEAAHVHCAMALDGFVYVCGLGIDAIFIYRDGDGVLREVDRIPMPPGSGPRHLAHSPKHPNWIYCVAELGSAVYALKREAARWRIDHSVSILPEDFDGANISAAIRITDDGVLLLASNRGHDSIAVIPLSPEGRLGAPVLSRCVAQPRDFLICGAHVLAASQRDSVIRAYRLNHVTLRLEDTGMALKIGCPVCLCPLDLQ